MDMVEEKVSNLDKWLNSISPDTKEVYEGVFNGVVGWFESDRSGLDLSRFEGDTPDRLLQLQKELNRDGESRKKILRSVYAYIKKHGKERSWSTSYRRKILSVTRSFFTYHLDETGFPREKARKIISVLKSDKRRAEKELGLEELQKVAIKSTPMYRSVIKAMTVSGMGEDEVVEFSNQGMGALRKAMEYPVVDGVIEVYLGSRKSNLDKDFYIYVGGGAYRELKNWLKVRDRVEKRFNDPRLRERREREANGVREFPDSVFVTNMFTPLSKSGFYTYFSRKMEQLGFIEKDEDGGPGTRYNKNPHQIRSIFRTQWSKSRVNPDIGEYFLGHTVDSLDYNRVHDDRDYRIKEYLKALPYLDMDNERAFGLVEEDEIARLQRELDDAKSWTQKIAEDEAARQVEGLRQQQAEIEAQLRRQLEDSRRQQAKIDAQLRELSGVDEKVEEALASKKAYDEATAGVLEILGSVKGPEDLEDVAARFSELHKKLTEKNSRK